METYLFEDYNVKLKVALKLMKISLENDPARYRELSGILQNTRDPNIIFSFYPEVMIAGVMYALFKQCKPDWDEDDWATHISFYDTMSWGLSLDNCPSKLNDYILAKIEHDYKHRYANYNTSLLRRMAQIVIDETDIEMNQALLEHFPIAKMSSSVNATNRNKKEGCYIATACYGSYDTPELLVFRNYRDNVLSKSLLGRLFIRCYYLISPFLVKVFFNKHGINRATRKLLDVIYILLKVK